MAERLEGAQLEQAINNAIIKAKLIERANNAEEIDEIEEIKKEYLKVLEKFGTGSETDAADIQDAADMVDPEEGAFTYDQVFQLHQALDAFAKDAEKAADEARKKALEDEAIAEIEADEADIEDRDALLADERARNSARKLEQAENVVKRARTASKSPPPAAPRRQRTVPPPSPTKAVAPAAKVVSNDDSLLIGAFPHLGALYKDLNLTPEAFWNVTDPYAVNKKNKGSDEDLKALKYKIFSAPYKKNPRKALIANYKIIEDIAEGLLIAEKAEGLYGKNASLGFTLQSNDAFEVDQDDVVFAKKVFAHRIQLGEHLTRNIGAKDPSAPSAARKTLGALLTPAATTWVNSEKFVTEFMPEEYSNDLAEFLKSELKLKDFKQTYLSKGKVTRNNYNRLLHLALEKEKLDSDGNLSADRLSSVTLPGKTRPSAVFRITPALGKLNTEVSDITYDASGKRVAAKNPKPTVGEAVRMKFPQYRDDELIHDSILTLSFTTTHTAETAPAEKDFIKGDQVDAAFNRESAAIQKFFALRKPGYDDATKSRNKIINKEKTKTRPAKTGPKTRKRVVKS